MQIHSNISLICVRTHENNLEIFVFSLLKNKKNTVTFENHLKNLTNFRKNKSLKCVTRLW